MREVCLDAIDELVRREMAEHHVPGIAVALVRDDKPVTLPGYGLANVEWHAPVTVDTVFQIRSLTKTFTSAAVLRLAAQGKLSLCDPVSAHLAGTPASWNEITLRHLLSHTSGLKDFINEPVASTRLEVTDEAIFATATGRPLNFPPGRQFQYCNTNYQLLAMILRRHTGKWYGDILAEWFFRPLGMSSTRVLSHSDIIPHRAGGYQWVDGKLVNGEFTAESILGYGGGGILSSATDLAKWAAAILAGRVLSRAALDEAWRPALPASSYGLGWEIGPGGPRRQVGHLGQHSAGFTNYLALYPDENLAVVVLSNSTATDAKGLALRIAG